MYENIQKQIKIKNNFTGRKKKLIKRRINKLPSRCTKFIKDNDNYIFINN